MKNVTKFINVLYSTTFNIKINYIIDFEKYKINIFLFPLQTKT